MTTAKEVKRGFYDFETYNWTEPLCCSLVWGDSRNPEKMWLHRGKKSRKAFLTEVIKSMATVARAESVCEWWAHNGGKFDALLFLELASQLELPVIGTPAAGRLISLRIGIEGITLDLKDSYAVVQSSLKNAIKDFGVSQAKLFEAGDYAADMRQMPKAKLKTANEADSVAGLQLLDVVESQVTEWGGQLRATFSSSAMSVLRSRIQLPSHKGEEWANEFSRNAYHGGRVEVFHHAPAKEIAELDVNSSYPWSMTQNLPWELKGRTDDKDFLDSDSEGVCFAGVDVPPMAIPPLPFKPSTGGVYFPTGSWEAWFTATELRYARTLGVQVRPMQAIAYTKAVGELSSFVRDLYALKATSTGAKRSFCKLMLNGCYGKFGMKPERETLRVFESEEAGFDFCRKHLGATSQLRLGSYRALSVKKFQWPKTTHYALASYVTAHSRILLHRYLLAADSRNLAYCDTDSIHTQKLTKPLSKAIGAELGALKLEGRFEQCRYYAPKIYQLVNSNGESHYASKGFPVSEEAFKKLIAGQSVTVERMQLSKSQLRKGGEFARTTDVKRWSGRSMKRFAFKDGTTRAWRVSELIDGKHLTMRSPVA